MKTIKDYQKAIDAGLITEGELLSMGILEAFSRDPELDGSTSAKAVPSTPVKSWAEANNFPMRNGKMLRGDKAFCAVIDLYLDGNAKLKWEQLRDYIPIRANTFAMLALAGINVPYEYVE